jgi:hypothetical protein
MKRLIVLAGLVLVGCASSDDAANQAAASRQSLQARAMSVDARFQGGASKSKSPALSGTAALSAGGAPTDYASAMAEQQRMRGGH